MQLSCSREEKPGAAWHSGVHGLGVPVPHLSTGFCSPALHLGVLPRQTAGSQTESLPLHSRFVFALPPLSQSHPHILCTGAATAFPAGQAPPQPWLQQLGTNKQLGEKRFGNQTCLPILCDLSDLQDGRSTETSALSLPQRISWAVFSTSRGCSHP